MKQMCTLIGSVIFVRHFESLAVKKNSILKPIWFFRLHLVHQSEVVQHVKVRAIHGGAPTHHSTAVLIKTDYYTWEKFITAKCCEIEENII